MNKGYLSRVIKKLTQDGLVCVNAAAARQSVKPLYLTDAGKALFVRMEKKRTRTLRNILPVRRRRRGPSFFG